MQVLFYSQLNTAPVQKQFDKTVLYLKQGDFKSADVRKMRNVGGFYRAKLDDTNRLLFQIGEYRGVKYLFLLEVILNHDYDKSRFLKGAKVVEDKLIEQHDTHKLDDSDVFEINFMNPDSSRFTVLDKIISFDKTQETVFFHPTPLILMGSAGSGKTMLALEKIKHSEGKVLFISLSAYLVEKARSIYNKDGYAQEGQEVHFFSLHDFLFRNATPKGREVTFADFALWFDRHRNASKIKDEHKIFEELRGVLTGGTDDKAFLSKEEYMALGTRQSVFLSSEREHLYALFLKYLSWLKAEQLFDINIAAFECLKNMEANYDMVVVDEVQDMTNVQLSLVLKTLKQPGNFILSGDANQVVHPNFFSWANVKRLLHGQNIQQEIQRVLPSNFRNSKAVTKLSNRLLKLKNVRFGSVDKESTFLVESKSNEDGEVLFVQENAEQLKALLELMNTCVQIAIIVLREEQKKKLQKIVNTPLIFTIQEAKGLEYDRIVLYNVISDAEKEFEDICEGLMPRNINTEELVYHRPKNKEDRSLDVYKFYINALYVGITRAIKGVYLVERKKHRLLTLLGMKDLRKTLRMHATMATIEEWQAEAQRLEKVGNTEQAQIIRKKTATYKTPDWEVMNRQQFFDLRHILLYGGKRLNIKVKKQLSEYALFYKDALCILLLFKHDHKIKPGGREEKELEDRMLAPYRTDKVQRIEPFIKKYGPNFRNELNLTPLMLAALAGAEKIAQYLVEAGADIMDMDNIGRTAFQLSMKRAYENEQYAADQFQRLLPLLRPPYIQMRRFKDCVNIASTNIAFYIISIFLTFQKEFLYYGANREHAGFKLDDFYKIIRHLPDEVLNKSKRKKSAIAACLHLHEFLNRKGMFVTKLRRGIFTMMPMTEICVNGEWTAFKDLYGWHEINALSAFTPAGELLKQDINDFLDRLQNFSKEFEEKLLAEMEEEERLNLTGPS